MDAFSTTLAVILAIICVASAVADFRLLPQVVETVARLRMPTRIIPALGMMKVAGAFGLLIGIWVEVLGSYAALCLSLYFLIATALHLRVRDTPAATAPAAVLFTVSLVTFLTGL